MALLTAVVVLYLGLTAACAVLTGLGAPLQTATRTGYLVGRLGAAALVVLDVVTLLRGHRPAELATHLGYAACALALPPLLTAAAGRTDGSPWPVAVACVATAVVLVRMAITWA